VSERLAADVAVVGSGPVGAAVARALHDRGARVLVLEAGAARAEPPGSHLLAGPIARGDMPAAFRAVRDALRPLAPEAIRRGVPAAAACHAVGGAGVVWSCLAPRFEEEERWPLPSGDWDAALARAEAALGVRAAPFAGAPAQTALEARLAPLGAGAAPMAVRAGPDGAPRLAGCAELLAPLLAPGGRSRVVAGAVVTRLRHAGGRVTGADARAAAGGAHYDIEARAFVVAAGAVLGAQLLAASGIVDDEEGPLGRYLTDHPVAYALARLDGELARCPGPFAVMLRGRADPPHRAFVLGTVPYDPRALDGGGGDGGGGARAGRVASVFVYGGVAPRRDNRVTFVRGEPDALGLPRPAFAYALTPEERRRALALVGVARDLVGRIGRPVAGAPAQLLAAGGSMHLLGTTRVGGGSAEAEAEAAAAAVAELSGRVRGLANLFVFGPGVVPTATLTNPTLTVVAHALRCVDAGAVS
jgi:choline dehydrogenase-like flavoprotein